MITRQVLAALLGVGLAAPALFAQRGDPPASLSFNGSEFVHRWSKGGEEALMQWSGIPTQAWIKALPLSP